MFNQKHLIDIRFRLNYPINVSQDARIIKKRNIKFIEGGSDDIPPFANIKSINKTIIHHEDVEVRVQNYYRI